MDKSKFDSDVGFYSLNKLKTTSFLNPRLDALLESTKEWWMVKWGRMNTTASQLPKIYHHQAISSKKKNCLRTYASLSAFLSMERLVNGKRSNAGNLFTPYSSLLFIQYGGREEVGYISCSKKTKEPREEIKKNLVKEKQVVLFTLFIIHLLFVNLQANNWKIAQIYLNEQIPLDSIVELYDTSVVATRELIHISDSVTNGPGLEIICDSLSDNAR